MGCFEIVRAALFWDRKQQHRHVALLNSNRVDEGIGRVPVRVLTAFRRSLVSNKSDFQLPNQNAGLPMKAKWSHGSGNNDLYMTIVRFGASETE
jgi:hypothetical protein